VVCVAAASAQAFAQSPSGKHNIAGTDPIVGTWTSPKGFVVDVEPSGSGFTGTVQATVPLAGSPCVTQVGSQVWTNITRQPDGTYTGTDHGWIWVTGGDASTCRDNPSGARWTLGAVTNGTLPMVATFSNPAFTTTTYTRPYSAPAPSTVTVIAAVIGKGRITGGTIDCPASCTATLTQAKLALKATPARGYRLVGWGKPACGPGVARSPCTLWLKPDGIVAAQLHGLIWVDYIIPTAGVVRVSATFVKSRS
jgi:hypothetical protein